MIKTLKYFIDKLEHDNKINEEAKRTAGFSVMDSWQNLKYTKI